MTIAWPITRSRLLLAVVRDVPQLDQATRKGVWRDTLPMRPNVSGKRLGIVGLGNIGEKVARRGAGFDMEIGLSQPQTA